MNTQIRPRIVSLVALVFLLAACSGDADTNQRNVNCDEVEIDNRTYCVYDDPITETGYQCPRDLPKRRQVGNQTVCSDDESIPDEHREQLGEGEDGVGNNGSTPNETDTIEAPDANDDTSEIRNKDAENNDSDQQSSDYACSEEEASKNSGNLEAAESCSTSCIENGDYDCETTQACLTNDQFLECTTQCIADEQEISLECSSCYSSLFECTFNSCAEPCGEGNADSDACDTCVEESGCIEDFIDCGGPSLAAEIASSGG